MATLEEALSSPSPLGSDLQAGVEAISSVQTITFTKYRRVVLPLDGFVFWIKGSIVAPGFLYNSLRPNSARARLNQAPTITVVADTLIVKGSLHYSTETRQEETENYGVNRIVFTSQKEVTDLSQVSPDELWVGTIDGIRFAFSARGSFYRQAALWHYVGNAVYSDMATQIIDDPRALNTRELIVSNSLPLWLALASYTPSTGIPNPRLALFPSFLLPNNLLPPYGAVDISGTMGLSSTARLTADLSHSQLSQDHVKLTTYGLGNQSIMDLLDTVSQYTLDRDTMGLMNIPVPRDEKRTQSELGTIAQKKVIEFDVNYYQSANRSIARQFIQSVVPSFIISSQVAA